MAVGMCFGTTGLTAVSITAIVNSTTVTLSNSTTTQATPTSLTVYNNTATQFTLNVTGVYVLETYTVNAGDTVVFSNQTSTILLGPWVCTVAGAVGVAPVFQRPSWFTGTASPVYLNILRGSTSQGSIYAIYPVAAAITDIVVGQTALSSSTIFGRATNAVLTSNTFGVATTQNFAAGTLTTAPIKFQAGVVQTTPVAHSVEWDSTSMYLTSLFSLSGTWSNVSTSVTVTAGSTSGLSVGAAVTSGITGTTLTVASIQSLTSFTLSGTPTNNGTALAFTLASRDSVVTTNSFGTY